MPIIRAKHGKANPYKQIATDLARDNRLTVLDRGLMFCMLSLPDDWEFSERGLMTTFCIGKSQLRSSLKRLETFGYLERRNQRRDPKTGRYDPGEWFVYETPRVPKPATGNENDQVAPASDYQTRVNNKNNITVADYPTAENRPVLNIDIQKTCTEGEGFSSQGMDFQPSKPPIVDTELRASPEACTRCGSYGLLTDGVAYKCEACGSEFSSLNDLYDIPEYQPY